MHITYIVVASKLTKLAGFEVDELELDHVVPTNLKTKST
jgi:hypothetical protein